jgi:hypothetical protein
MPRKRRGPKTTVRAVLELQPLFERLIEIIFFWIWCNCGLVMKLHGRQYTILGSHIIQ